MSTPPPCDGTNAGQCSPTELQKLQLDYAWNWFSFHADQRIKVYNFMLAALAFLVAAIVTAIDKGRTGIAVVLCIFSALLALVFVLLDRRNRDLERLGEEVLKDLEGKVLFTQTSGVVTGILLSPKHESGYPESLRSIATTRNLRLGKHRLLLPGTALLFAALFVGGAAYLYSAQREPIKADDNPTVKVYCPVCPPKPSTAVSEGATPP